MGAFDDLIPQQAGGGGSFADLIPQQAPQAGAEDIFAGLPQNVIDKIKADTAATRLTTS